MPKNPETIKEIKRIRDQLSQKIIPSGDQPPYKRLKPGEKDPEEPYKVVHDDLHHFTSGNFISANEYDSVKKEYGIRIKRWVSGLFENGVKNYYISGPGREAVKDVAFEYADTKKEYPHTHLHISGNKIRPLNIIAEANSQNMNVLWVDVSHKPV
jgi:hypothetical protein